MNPLVSVCCMTYNHSNYIRQCLDGFIIQKTNFKFEVFIHDDASTDNTTEIVREYEAKYPNLFRCIYQTENQFDKQNALTDLIFPSTRGKYIALCEGDDFWTDEYKLQKQVDVLEAEPSLSCCFHSVVVRNEIANITYEYPTPPKKVLNFKDILSKHYIATCSLLFRISLLPNPLPDWFSKSKIGDIPLELMLADKGDIVFIDEKMACYRRNVYSLTSSKKQIKEGRSIFLDVYKNLNKQFGYKYWHLFGWKIGRLYLGYIKDILRPAK
jgi:glycosyltransferase involved in cell wall biosynthesis